MRLNNEIAFITGSARGIGREIAETFAREGALVIISDIKQEDCQATVAELVAKGLKADAFACNVTVSADVEKTVEQIIEKHGRIDILVNNAGITRDGLFLRMKEEDWDAVINVNLKGTFNACKSVSKVMIKARKGKIINIGSVIGVMGNAGQANYAASKAGVIALAKSLAKEFASRNITVNAVAPGYIKTAMTDKLSDEVKNKILEAVPLGRMGLPQDVANVCLFLASKEADYVTGQTVLVDGGMVTY
ncbi:MAG: 3-oxoacyl-[acyl-carrier-protein] reductase [Candidatus Omnitrophica bacterium]|nr:3-oxoacyl-[acyl-carrier-protein] reductase [Candidatus Omnitrophota bacterium]